MMYPILGGRNTRNARPVAIRYGSVFCIVKKSNLLLPMTVPGALLLFRLARKDDGQPCRSMVGQEFPSLLLPWVHPVSAYFSM